jgi:acyl-CoA thioesterase
VADRTARAVAEDAVREFLAGDAVTATAVERSAVGRGAIYDVAVTRDGDGQLLAELRAHSRQLTTRPGSPG